MKRFSVAVCTGIFVLLGTLVIPATSSAQKIAIAVVPPVWISDAIPADQRQALRPKMIVGAFERALRSSRKFRVLSRRDDMQARVTSEQRLAAGTVFDGDGPAIGGFETAQYVVALAVQGFRFERDEDHVVELDRYRRVDLARLTLEAQVLDTKTDEIAGAYSVTKTVNSAPKLVAQPGGTPPASLLDRVATQAARNVIGQFLDNVFPMKVVKAQGDHVFINYGGDDAIAEGEVFDVYGRGDVLIDPDTGERLGRSEIRKGKVEIEQVNPKFSIGKVLSTRDPIARGDILRQADR